LADIAMDDCPARLGPQSEPGPSELKATNAMAARVARREYEAEARFEFHANLFAE
jgi:hypothetical protein